MVESKGEGKEGAGTIPVSRTRAWHFFPIAIMRHLAASQQGKKGRVGGRYGGNPFEVTEQKIKRSTLAGSSDDLHPTRLEEEGPDDMTDRMHL